MENYLLFGLLSLPVIFISRKSLFRIKSHGFYRFFSWECILWLFAINVRFWFVDPFCLMQLFSWLFLFIATYLVLSGVIELRKAKRTDSGRSDDNLYEFEKTSKLVDTGIFKWIRHPMYSSLLFLTWGIFLKNTAGILLMVSILSSIFLIFTARVDERECIAYFGDNYRNYMKRTKRFIPYII
jgi:protein-S-isoprenylcysteine O-methyltransferase Ste14